MYELLFYQEIRVLIPGRFPYNVTTRQHRCSDGLLCADVLEDPNAVDLTPWYPSAFWTHSAMWTHHTSSDCTLYYY